MIVRIIQNKKERRKKLSKRREEQKQLEKLSLDVITDELGEALVRGEELNTN